MGVISIPPTLASRSTGNVHFFKRHSVASDEIGFPLVRKGLELWMGKQQHLPQTPREVLYREMGDSVTLRQ